MNKSNDFRGHVAEAVKTLQIPESNFWLVSLYQYEDILVSILNEFTDLGNKGLNCGWWWNDFNQPKASFHLAYPPGILEQLIPPEEIVWFIPEDSFYQKQNGLHWVYEGKLKTVVAVIGEMYAFEYYIASKKFKWLLGETHHDVLVGTGNYIVERIENYKTNRDSTEG